MLGRFSIVCLSWALLPVALFAAPREGKLTKTTTVRLATKEEGEKLITREDDFLAALSRFDLQSRLKTDRDVKVADLTALYRDNVTEWNDEEAEKVLIACAALGEKLAKYDVPLPKEVFIVRTTGKEESGAAYCRGPAVVLPANLLKQGVKSLERLMAHELFHVLSSHNPELRRDLYAIIGFTTCDPIAVPMALRDQTIANPDAPRIDCTMNLELADGTKVIAAPLLVAIPDKFDPAARKSMFNHMQFRMIVVEKNGDKWQPVLKDGAPQLLDAAKLDSFHKQIGRNTGYIIHPDEILADNFLHMTIPPGNLPSPEITEKMAARLKPKAQP